MQTSSGALFSAEALEVTVRLKYSLSVSPRTSADSRSQSEETAGIYADEGRHTEPAGEIGGAAGDRDFELYESRAAISTMGRRAEDRSCRHALTLRSLRALAATVDAIVAVVVALVEGDGAAYDQSQSLTRFQRGRMVRSGRQSPNGLRSGRMTSTNRQRHLAF